MKPAIDIQNEIIDSNGDIKILIFTKCQRVINVTGHYRYFFSTNEELKAISVKLDERFGINFLIHYENEN